ncbi:unnamed protein product [Adineta steineri]|uniref:NAD(P)(+)--arginine ADP-ribosyltransferase n=1 Tax=Adineta steineri TaxID=433720 RepID=A0A819RGJ9_9BILA|nr:unnamed protein product [Adineta steineri]CAF4047343.1 unnamed protein product [Adineta steineri]
MAENNKGMIELNQSLLNTEENNQIEKYINLDNNIKTIDRLSSDGQVALHVASFCGHSEIVQFFLTDSAFTSLATTSPQLTLVDQLKRAEIRRLVVTASSLHDFREEIPDNNYIVWSINGESLVRKGREFREQIDLYKTYDNQHHLITKLLIEIVEYYLNEYLIQQDYFSKDNIEKVKDCFTKAIEEQNYLKYFIKAYTFANNFHHVLNKHLALYILHYFDTQPYTSTPAEYRLINCLAHIVTLLINHPDARQHKYKGITYRGMLMSPNDLKPYRIGNYILNKSFMSTSKDLAVAQMYAGSGQKIVLRRNSNHRDPSEVSVILKFTIKHDDTGVDIEHMSMIEDEEEVLILPFSVFQVKDRIENGSNTDSPGLIEIYLEQCEDNEQVNNKNPKTLSFNQPKFCPTADWNPYGITFANQTILGKYRTYTLFIDTNNTVYTVNREKRQILTWINNSINPNKIISANFSDSYSIFVTNNGDIYYHNDRSNGQVDKWISNTNTSVNAMNVDSPCYGLFIDINDTLYCSMFRRDKIIKRWLDDSELISTTAAGTGRSGSNSNELYGPKGIFVDVNFDLYVADCDNHRIQLFKHGELNGTTIVGKGSSNNIISLYYPTGIALDADKYLYIVDRGNDRIIRSGPNSFRCIIGCNGEGSQSHQLSSPTSLSFDSYGNIFITDSDNHRIQKFDFLPNSCAKF